MSADGHARAVLVRGATRVHVVRGRAPRAGVVVAYRSAPFGRVVVTLRDAAGRSWRADVRALRVPGE